MESISVSDEMSDAPKGKTVPISVCRDFARPLVALTSTGISSEAVRTKKSSSSVESSRL